MNDENDESKSGERSPLELSSQTTKLSRREILVLSENSEAFLVSDEHLPPQKTPVTSPADRASAGQPVEKKRSFAFEATKPRLAPLSQQIMPAAGQQRLEPAPPAAPPQAAREDRAANLEEENFDPSFDDIFDDFDAEDWPGFGESNAPRDPTDDASHLPLSSDEAPEALAASVEAQAHGTAAAPAPARAVASPEESPQEQPRTETVARSGAKDAGVYGAGVSESVDDEAEYELEEVSLGRSRSWGWIVAAIAILALLCAALIALGYMDWAREPLERLISS